MASTRSRHASSGVSRPATSESEGWLDQNPLGDDDSDEEDNDDNLNASITKKENISASKKKRDNALKSEVCRVPLLIYFLALLPAYTCSVL
jgi:hypothetical protein